MPYKLWLKIQLQSHMLVKYTNGCVTEAGSNKRGEGVDKMSRKPRALEITTELENLINTGSTVIFVMLQLNTLRRIDNFDQ